MPPIHGELLDSASRLAVSECAYVILNNGDRGIIVPPGASGKMITVRLIASRAGSRREPHRRGRRYWCSQAIYKVTTVPFPHPASGRPKMYLLSPNQNDPTICVRSHIRSVAGTTAR